MWRFFLVFIVAVSALSNHGVRTRLRSDSDCEELFGANACKDTCLMNEMSSQLTCSQSGFTCCGPMTTLTHIINNLEGDDKAKILGETRLKQLMFPGSHDAGTHGEPYWLSLLAKRPWVVTQSLSIADQLAAGSRWFDIRWKLDDNGIWRIYHGAAKGIGALFEDRVTVHKQLLTFLEDPKNRYEIVVWRIKFYDAKSQQIKDFIVDFEKTFLSFTFLPKSDEPNLGESTLTQIYGDRTKATLIAYEYTWKDDAQNYFWNYTKVQDGTFSKGTDLKLVVTKQTEKYQEWALKPEPRVPFAFWFTFTFTPGGAFNGGLSVLAMTNQAIFKTMFENHINSKVLQIEAMMGTTGRNPTWIIVDFYDRGEILLWSQIHNAKVLTAKQIKGKPEEIYAALEPCPNKYCKESCPNSALTIPNHDFLVSTIKPGFACKAKLVCCIPSAPPLLPNDFSRFDTLTESTFKLDLTMPTQSTFQLFKLDSKRDVAELNVGEGANGLFYSLADQYFGDRNLHAVVRAIIKDERARSGDTPDEDKYYPGSNGSPKDIQAFANLAQNSVYLITKDGIKKVTPKVVDKKKQYVEGKHPVLLTLRGNKVPVYHSAYFTLDQRYLTHER